MATKEQLYAVQTQVNSIEQQLRETKTEVRLGALEEKVFGAPARSSNRGWPLDPRPAMPLSDARNTYQTSRQERRACAISPLPRVSTPLAFLHSARCGTIPTPSALSSSPRSRRIVNGAFEFPASRSRS